MVTGETGEITTQNIRLNEYIRQYAKIQNVNNGAVYYNDCQDCTCKLDVYDSSNRVLFKNVQTTQLSSGLFGYIATSQYFQVNNDYNAIFNCTSIAYGSGLVSSVVHIDEGVVDGSLEIGTQSDSLIPSLTDSGGFWDGLAQVFADTLNTYNDILLNSWLDIIAPNRQADLRQRIDNSNSLYDILIYIWDMGATALAFITFLWDLAILLLTDQQAFLSKIWGYNLTLLYMILTLTMPFFMFFLLIELWIMSQSLNRNFFGMIEVFITKNIQLISVVYVGFSFVANLLISGINLFVGILMSIRNLLPI